MKNRNGFTLIELLAVIVILAIIALIATPMILGVVETAKKGAAETSILGYVDAVEKEIASSMLDSEEIEDGLYQLGELKVDMKGTKPKYGVITIKNSGVIYGKFCINNYSLKYENNKASIVKGVDYCSNNFNDFVKLTYDNKTITNELKNTNTTTFNIDRTSEANFKYISCNNGSTVSYSNGLVTVNNIKENTSCQIETNLVEINSKLDNTENNVVILNDQTTEKEILFGSNKKINIDLNGKKIEANIKQGLFNFYGDNMIVNIKDSVGTGKLVNNAFDTVAVGGKNTIVNTNVNIESGRSAVRIYSAGLNSTININNSNIVCTDVVYDYCVATSKATETININDTTVTAYHTGVGSTEGTTNINNSTVTSTTSNAIYIYDNTKTGLGILNINNSKILAYGNLSTIDNLSQTAKITNSYVYSQKHQGIRNTDGKITIDGDLAKLDVNNNYVSGMYIETPASHYIYNAGIATTYLNNATVKSYAKLWNGRGKVYIKDGDFTTIVESPLGFGTNATEIRGKIYVTGGKFTSQHQSISGSNGSKGDIYICGGELNSPIDLYNGSIDTNIYYKSTGIKWKNGSTPILGGSYMSNIKLDNSITCEG